LRSTNAWRAYEWASGTKVDDESEPAGLVGSLAAGGVTSSPEKMCRFA
jgi:hypothetical protein